MQGTDLPACTLTLASLCSPGLREPGCLPQAGSAWEHSWKAWDAGYQLLWSPDHSSFPLECPVCSLVCALGHPLLALLGGPPGLHSWPLWEKGGNCWRWQRMTGKHILEPAACLGASAKPCSETEPCPDSVHFCGGQMFLPRPPSSPSTATRTNGVLG